MIIPTVSQAVRLMGFDAGGGPLPQVKSHLISYGLWHGGRLSRDGIDDGNVDGARTGADLD